MILSGADIQQYIRYGGLSFSPLLSPDQFQQNGVDLILDSAHSPLLHSGRSTLGRTRERLHLPCDLMAWVQLRSTWARERFFLPPTIIDAGFEGTITLEIGWMADEATSDWLATTNLPLGQRFAHIIFGKLASPSAPYCGRYQGQQEITRAIHDPRSLRNDGASTL